MTVELVYTAKLAEYRLSETHALRPERFVLAVELMREWGLVCDEPPAERPAERPCATMVRPGPASMDDLLRAHSLEYIRAVGEAGKNPGAWTGGFGIGPGDTPAFVRMGQAAALIAGSTTTALMDVASGRCQRAFAPAAGMHHAHRDRAAGFCIYNDAAVAIERLTAEHPGTRVAYVDLDVHHGDGVQEAFYNRADVLTISIHESGRYLFPGTGRPVETGEGSGAGFAINLPLAPGAGDDSYDLILEAVVAPALRAFSPDVIVAQLGADTHRSDPLGHLATTVAGQYRNAVRLVTIADEVCAGRIAATGGGGYETFSAVPRSWACVLAALLGVEPPAELPDAWRLHAAELAERAGADSHIPKLTFDEPAEEGSAPWGGDPLGETQRSVVRLRAEHPLLRDHA